MHFTTSSGIRGGLTADGVGLLQDRFRVVLRKDHPFSSLEQVWLPELLEDPLLVSLGGCEPHIRQLHALSGVHYNPAQCVREISTLLSMVMAEVRTDAVFMGVE